jgi:hypothetical protein
MVLVALSFQQVMAGVLFCRHHFVRSIHTSLDRHNYSLMACLSKRLEMCSFAMKEWFISNTLILG